MNERKIGDPKLQKLFEEDGVIWKVSIRQRVNVPLLRVIFPVPQDLDVLKKACRCGALANVILKTEEHPFTENGVIVKFENVQRYEVDENQCGFLNMDDEAHPQLLEQLVEDIDTLETMMVRECLYGKSPEENNQTKIIHQTITFVSDRLERYNICPRMPSKTMIKRALCTF